MASISKVCTFTSPVTTVLPCRLSRADDRDRIRTVERFTPNADYSRLDYTLTTTDEVNFARPFTLTRYFVWRPENTVHPYECLDRF